MAAFFYFYPENKAAAPGRKQIINSEYYEEIHQGLFCLFQS